MTLIWFTYKPDPAMMYEVQKAGHECVQATSEMVIRGVAAQYPNNLIIIGPDIPPSRAQGIRQNYPTIMLTPEATAKELIWELSKLFPGTPSKIQ